MREWWVDLVLASYMVLSLNIFKNKTLTKVKTEAVSHLIVADIYGGFCRSVFTQFCPSQPLITRRELAENNWNNYTPAASQDKDLLFYCTPRGVAYREVQITTDR